MSKVLVTSGHLQDIADAIRGKNGESTPYRPGDMAAAIQALDGSGYPEPTGSMEITANGTYDVKDVAEAAVNVSAGGATLELNYDFTRSATDTVRGVPIVSYGNVTQTASGLVMSGTSTYLQLQPRYSADTFTYELDIASITIRNGSHNRLVMGRGGSGLIYRSTGKWAFYNGNWQETDVTDGAYLNGCTLKVYIDENGYWHIYRNNVLWFEPSSSLSMDENYYGSTYECLMIGSRSGSSPSGITITGFRAY